MNELTLLQTWQKRARESTEVHYQLAARYGLWNTLLTVLVVSLTAVVGSAVFASVQTRDPWQWVLGGLSVFAAAVAAIQRSLGWSELSERHRLSGAGWDKLFDEITDALAPPGEHRQLLTDVERKMGALVDRSPYIPQRLFEKRGLAKTYETLLKD